MDTGEIYYLFLGDIEIYEEQTFQFHFLPGYAFITCNIVTNSILVVIQWPYFRIRSILQFVNLLQSNIMFIKS